jgi:hypothetical protein
MKIEITKAPNLTTNGYVKTSGSDGTLSVDTSALLVDPTTTRGDIIVRGASALERLQLGTSGYVLKSDGTDVVWGTAGSGAPGGSSGDLQMNDGAGGFAYGGLNYTNGTKTTIYPGGNSWLPTTDDAASMIWKTAGGTQAMVLDTITYQGTAYTNVGKLSVGVSSGEISNFNQLQVSGSDIAVYTATLSNKRITKRVTTITSSNAPTINTNNCDCVTITALGTAVSTMSTNLSGNPNNFDSLIFRIKDDGVARSLSWGSAFTAMGVALPTITTAGKVTTVGFSYDSVGSAWGCLAVATQS